MNGKSFVAGMATGAAILASGMIMGGMQRNQPNRAAAPQDAVYGTLTASAVQIVNEKGAVVAALRGSRYGGELAISNAQAKGVMMLGARRGGGQLEIADDNSSRRLSLENDGTVVVYGADGKKRAQMAAFKMDGNTRSEFSGQFVAMDRNEAVVQKLPE